MYGHTLTWTPGNVLIQFLSRLSPDLGMSGKNRSQEDLWGYPFRAEKMFKMNTFTTILLTKNFSGDWFPVLGWPPMYGHTLTWTPGNVLIQFLSRLSPDLGMSGKNRSQEDLWGVPFPSRKNVQNEHFYHNTFD